MRFNPCRALKIPVSLHASDQIREGIANLDCTEGATLGGAETTPFGQASMRTQRNLVVTGRKVVYTEYKQELCRVRRRAYLFPRQGKHPRSADPWYVVTPTTRPACFSERSSA